MSLGKPAIPLSRLCTESLIEQQGPVATKPQALAPASHQKPGKPCQHWEIPQLLASYRIAEASKLPAELKPQNPQMPVKGPRSPLEPF